ncbi:FAD binding domain-containing protein [Halosimplex pelagicum]|uniref:FAD binding domain-containing protein n=1 Tax=Halosimplex pelagicum TaxID=869886 RepID=A0A7D5P633_9EURY|nr:FAD binding domain-containing protein [Halosimplex pelagicum]QLH81726.1 FAD binding domain-containing protein [Halosimplex pelagicum]
MTERAGDVAGETEAEYYRPESVAAACRRLRDADGRARVVAGGQTLMPLVRQGLVDADAFVDVSAVPALSGVSVDGDRATVGATTTYAGLGRHDLSDRVAALDEACSVVADRQVRSLGTVGGAVAHGDPTFDLLAPLRALDAEVRLAGPDDRRCVPLGEFLVGHLRTDRREHELVTGVTFDRLDPDRTGSAYERHAAAGSGRATAGVAAVVTLADDTVERVRVACSAVADTPVRAHAVENDLVGGPATAEAVTAASERVPEDIDPIDDEAGSAAYKRRLAATLVERSLLSALGRAGGSP